jgi:type IV secretory pathway VirB10-like protein
MLELEEVLDRGRSVRPAPELVRGRVLSRARRVLRTPVLVDPPRARRALFAGRAALAATLVLGVAAAALALRQSARHQPQSSAPLVAVASVRPSDPPASKPAAGAPPPEYAESSLVPPPPSPPRLASRNANSASIDTESELMRRAHSAYAERNFGNALTLVSEHAKRFPRGVLSEEREALRVGSLSAAGRTAEARRAAAAFAQRFPRSVLLARIQAFARPNPDRAR